MTIVHNKGCACLNAYDAGNHLELLELSLPPADNLVLELVVVILHLHQTLLLGRVVLPLLLVLNGCLLLLLRKIQLVILQDATRFRWLQWHCAWDVACWMQPEVWPTTDPGQLKVRGRCLCGKAGRL